MREEGQRRPTRLERAPGGGCGRCLGCCYCWSRHVCARLVQGWWRRRRRGLLLDATSLVSSHFDLYTCIQRYTGSQDGKCGRATVYALLCSVLFSLRRRAADSTALRLVRRQPSSSREPDSTRAATPYSIRAGKATTASRVVVLLLHVLLIVGTCQRATSPPQPGNSRPNSLTINKHPSAQSARTYSLSEVRPERPRNRPSPLQLLAPSTPA